MFFFHLSWAAAAAMSDLEGCAALGAHSQHSTHRLLPGLVGAGDAALFLVYFWFVSGLFLLCFWFVSGLLLVLSCLTGCPMSRAAIQNGAFHWSGRSS